MGVKSMLGRSRLLKFIAEHQRGAAQTAISTSATMLPEAAAAQEKITPQREV